MKARAWIKLLRVSQWLKNLMLFFPPFLSGSISGSDAARGALPFSAFCLVSSATYIYNDVRDRHIDSLHPVKRTRAVSSGTISVPTALSGAVFLAVAGGGIGRAVSGTFFLLLALYAVVSIAYSSMLKNYPIVDLFCIASGFLIRLEAGGTAFGIPVSNWLFLSVFLLALFLSTGKRLSERRVLGAEAGGHRKTLDLYPEGFLDGVMYMTGAAVLVTYTMYSLPRPLLVYSVPLCCFGLLRFIFRVKSGLSGDPTESLTRDPVLFAVAVAWTFMIFLGIYG
ncbi:MAG TPA: decaprenyl-phosphate phosphoribosyltransferase [Verrucomicrobiae bacterium]|nr:decaprenyl-phosphate phosphoribosyltransferase [Verrucomicrobiae bacterium]